MIIATTNRGDHRLMQRNDRPLGRPLPYQTSRAPFTIEQINSLSFPGVALPGTSLVPKFLLRHNRLNVRAVPLPRA